jgi:hypothetical protein
VSNLFGSCHGVEACGADAGWAACSAPEPAPEICNGVDDDCDGLTDALDPTLIPAEDPLFPGCQSGDGCFGSWVCHRLAAGEVGWECTARTPTSEICNGLDDDCDGVTDNGFVDEAGRYVGVSDCGACGNDCTAIANLLRDATGMVAAGAVTCETPGGGAPRCTVHACQPRFYPVPSGAAAVCLSVDDAVCQPCVADAECAGPGDRCLVNGGDPQAVCALDCSAASAHSSGDPTGSGYCTGETGVGSCCPAGFTCTQVGALALCLPDSGTCECTAALAGARRPCAKAGNGQVRYCAGTQTCTETPTGSGAWAWSACDPSQTTLEICNHLDDDCDGATDEGFVDTQGSGTYDSDANCGDCGHDCRLAWERGTDHVAGHCAVDPAPVCRFGPDDCLELPGPGGRPCDAGCGAGEVCLTRAVPGVGWDYFQCGRTCTPSCPGSFDCLGGACLRQCAVGAPGDALCQTTHGPLSRCVAGHCQVLYAWRDVNGLATDGCECPAATLAPEDTPRTFTTYPAAGEYYLDTDCDGVDGVAAKAVFVSATHQGVADGSRAAPFRTIADGIAQLLAYPSAKSYVLVAAGIYRENVVLTPGVKLYGGYALDFGARDIVRHATVIMGAQPDPADAEHRRGTVSAECQRAEWNGALDVPTVIAGFKIYGYDVSFQPDPGGAGMSSYAVYVRDCHAALEITNNWVIGGRGGPAGAAPAGAVGVAGGVGGNGQPSQPCCAPGSTCTDCSGTPLAGGAGGAKCESGGVDGETGGDSSTAAGSYQYHCSTDYCKANCRYDCTATAGGAGANGGDGLPGGSMAGAAGCALPAGGLSGDEWRGLAAAIGPAGETGDRGLRGRAGYWVSYGSHQPPPTCAPANLYQVGDFGGTGGGGGAGGCGGTGGVGGPPGGASIGVFVYVLDASPASLPMIRGNLIEAGEGGDGGGGGPGGLGGLGGQGGVGGTVGVDDRYPWSWCGGRGGAGGNGGAGGAGGGGGGGCGGSAFGLAGYHIAAGSYDTANTIPLAGTAGPGGPGGLSPGGAAGGAGAAGARVAYRAF